MMEQHQTSGTGAKRSRSKSIVRSRKRKLSKGTPNTLYGRSTPTVSIFEDYVSTENFLPASDHSRLFYHLRSQLPVNFRIRAAAAQKEFDEWLWSGRVQAKALPGIPGAYQMSPDEIDRNYMLRKWLSQNTKLGNVSRQEFVSMLPVLLLDIASHHRILDLCASPGSKTTQAVDALYADSMTTDSGRRTKPPKGFCIANEIDPKRAYILSHRCRETLTDRQVSLAVACHNATKFPNVQAALKVSSDPSSKGSGPYDRIICDVPCSGDGTLRKDLKVWRTWHPSYGISLHPLQVRIAKRGIALLKLGGIMTYSSCSFHPIENEAVVAALLATGCVEILPPSSLDEIGIRYRRGLERWKVLDDEMEPVDSSRADMPSTLWPPSNTSILSKLSNCVRMVPQDNDTGGFFIALLRKVGEFPPTKKSTSPDEKLVTPKAAHHRLKRVPKGETEEQLGCVAFKRSLNNGRFFHVCKSLSKHLDGDVGSDKLNLVSAGFCKKVSSVIDTIILIQYSKSTLEKLRLSFAMVDVLERPQSVNLRATSNWIAT